ncbi:mak16-a [Symbiodinium sp. CCMP2592]|nr:mak16-a [Symbiodinium sp. CCMP2592]
MASSPVFLGQFSGSLGPFGLLDLRVCSYHGRPLRLRACQDGQESMEWVWEGERIKHAHSPYFFDLAGHNVTNLGDNRYSPDDYGWLGFPAVQLGAQDPSASSDQDFFREILASLENLTQSFEPLPATEVLPGLPREQENLCPDGSFGERNVCPIVRRRSRTDFLCRGGTLTLKCVWFPGYFLVVVGPTPDVADLGKLDYTCCRGESNSDECGDNVIWFPLAVALIVLGVLGVLTRSLMIHCYNPSIAHATEADLQVLCPQHVHDGAALHRRVEPAKRGVSLEDLRQFKRLVHHAVKSGSIRATDRDQFAMSDVAMGLRILGHEEPQGLTFASCPILKIWCVDEAVLAASWDKPIRLAKRPLPNQWPGVLRVLSTGAAAFGAGMLYPLAAITWYGISPDSFSLHWDLEWAFAYVGGTFGAFVALTFKCCFRRATATIQVAIHCMTVFLALSVAVLASWHGLCDRQISLLRISKGPSGMPRALIPTICEEFFARSLMAANVSTAQLRSVVNVTGHLKDLSRLEQIS